MIFTTDTMQGVALIPKVPRYVKKYVEFFADLTLQGACMAVLWLALYPSTQCARLGLCAPRALAALVLTPLLDGASRTP